MIPIIPIAAGAFIATNLDNFALLVMFLVRYRHRAVIVAVAYFSSIFLLISIGYGVGYISAIAPVEYLGWLGLVPIGLGIAGVVGLFRDRTPSCATRGSSVAGSVTAFLATLTSQLGNGTDTIITFGVLFADSNAASDSLIIVAVAAMTIFFFAGARYAIRHPALEKWIEKHARLMTPFMLIIVGTYVLANTATDILPG